MRFFAYITEQGRKNALHFKYKGSDHSILFNKFLNPYVFNNAVHFLPMWMAPNLVTLIGLMLVISSYFITWSYMPNFEGEAPWWCYAWNGVALLAYQCLDAIDGKQARRTGSSSALGMLFDHGCDVLNLCLTSMTLVSTAQLGGSWKSALCVSAGSLVFFLATMEEYWSGELSLPIINGPNEGILAGACIHFLTAALGPSFWLQESIVAGLLWQDWFLVASLGLLPVQIAYSAWCISDSVRRVRRGELPNPQSGATEHAASGGGESVPLSAAAAAAAGPTKPTYYYALSRAIPLLLLLAMWWIWVVLSPSGIYRMYPRAMCLLLSFVYCKMTMLIMLAHVCGEIYHPWSKTSALLLGLAAHATFNVAFAFVPGALRQYEEAVLMQCLTITGVTYVHLVYGTVSELCSALNIRCFTIKPASAAQIHAAAVARVEAIGWLTRERMPTANPPANDATSNLRTKSS